MKARRWGDCQHRLGARPPRERRQAVYVAAKHGVVDLSKVVALGIANDGVTCNAICPGWMPHALGGRHGSRAGERGNAA